MEIQMKTFTSAQLIVILLLLLLTNACDMGHFFTDSGYKEKVEFQFSKQRELAKKREKVLFEIIDDDSVTMREKEALIFLYAYMPINDLADYNSEFFLENVRIALETRGTFSWGKKSRTKFSAILSFHTA